MTLPQLDRHSTEPLYIQIEKLLLDRIRSGALKPGHAIPSEQELAAKLRISRMTARQALKSLCDRGIAYSQRGRGTFVSRIKMEKNVHQLLSFTEEMGAHGWRPQSKVLSFEEIPATAAVAEGLHLETGENVICLRRLRLTDSLPMGLEQSHIPAALVPDLLERFDPRTSLYQTLAEKYGIQLVVADEVAEAGLASAEDARLLGITKVTPVFLFTRISYVQSGEPVEYVKAVYRGDRNKLFNRLTRQNMAGQ